MNSKSFVPTHILARLPPPLRLGLVHQSPAPAFTLHNTHHIARRRSKTADKVVFGIVVLIPDLDLQLGRRRSRRQKEREFRERRVQ